MTTTLRSRFRSPVAPALAALLCASLCGLIVASCGKTEAEIAFDEYLARADRTPPELTESDALGVFEDITGSYLASIFIRPLGEVYLDLRISFTEFELLADGTGALVTGNFTFPDEPADAPPLAEFESLYSVDGTLQIATGYVRIEPERSPIEDTAVEVEFILDIIVLEHSEFCGVITDTESATVLPLPLVLQGTTLGAKRYGDEGEVPVDIPVACPAGTTSEPDAGIDVGSDVGTDVGDVGTDVAEDSGLVPPDVELDGGVRADVSGRFWFAASIPGLPTELGLIADITYHEDGETASMDGTLRSTSDLAGPAAGVFSVPVDEEGGFTVIIPQLLASIGPIALEAELALTGVIQSEDFFCGAGAGSVTSPLSLDLEGSTFGAIRLEDDAIEEPNQAFTSCP